MHQVMYNTAKNILYKYADACFLYLLNLQDLRGAIAFLSNACASFYYLGTVAAIKMSKVYLYKLNINFTNFLSMIFFEL